MTYFSSISNSILHSDVCVNCVVFQILNQTFPKHTFLMNGLIQGVKVGVDF